MLTNSITILTGTPGAGKTLRSIYEGIKLAKSGRKVYFFGVEGLDVEKIKEIYDVEVYTVDDDFILENWRSLPNNTALIIDEAHKFLPTRQPGKPPEWIEKLTEIRHFGLQFILVTQDPRNIDAFVRRLCAEHIHVSRKAGFAGAVVRTFQGVSENPDDYHAKQTATTEMWKYDKKLYEVYKSASLHIIQPKIPTKLFVYGVLAVLLAIAIPTAIYFAFNRVKESAGSETPTSSLSPLRTKSEAIEYKRADLDTYIKAHEPLTPVHPWSAPIYEGLQPVDVPRLYCIASGYENTPQRRCTCYTEQVTKVMDIPDYICEHIVKNGQYNPYIPAYESSNNSNSLGVDSGERANVNALPASHVPPSESILSP